MNDTPMLFGRPARQHIEYMTTIVTPRSDGQFITFGILEPMRRFLIEEKVDAGTDQATFTVSELHPWGLDEDKVKVLHTWTGKAGRPGFELQLEAEQHLRERNLFPRRPA